MSILAFAPELGLGAFDGFDPNIWEGVTPAIVAEAPHSVAGLGGPRYVLLKTNVGLAL